MLIKVSTSQYLLIILNIVILPRVAQAHPIVFTTCCHHQQGLVIPALTLYCKQENLLAILQCYCLIHRHNSQRLSCLQYITCRVFTDRKREHYRDGGESSLSQQTNLHIWGYRKSVQLHIQIELQFITHTVTE